MKAVQNNFNILFCVLLLFKPDLKKKLSLELSKKLHLHRSTASQKICHTSFSIFFNLNIYL